MAMTKEERAAYQKAYRAKKKAEGTPVPSGSRTKHKKHKKVSEITEEERENRNTKAREYRWKKIRQRWEAE